MDERALDRPQAARRVAQRELVVTHRLRIVRAGVTIDIFTKGELSKKPDA